MQVLAVQQAEKLRVIEEVPPREVDQAADCIGRGERLEVQFPLGLPDVGVGRLQHRQEEVFLVAEVVVDELLVDARTAGDAVDARAAEAALGELAHRGAQDRLLRSIGVPRAQFDDVLDGGRHADIIHRAVN